MPQKTKPFIKDILHFLYDLFPTKNAEKWDNKQLINARLVYQSPRMISVGLDLLHHDLGKLKQNHTNLVITHHPLWINGRLRDPGAKLIKKFLIANKIVFLALHTQFDKSEFGTNFQIIKKIPLFKLTSIVKHGFLSYVELNKQVEPAELISQLSTVLGLNGCKFSFQPELGQISRVAICAGSGYDLINQVNWKKADVFITGDLKYHDWVNVERNLYNVIDLGHEVEKIFGNYLKSLIENNFGLKVALLADKTLFSL